MKRRYSVVHGLIAGDWIVVDRKHGLVVAHFSSRATARAEANHLNEAKLNEDNERGSYYVHRKSK
jgi:hypothetical protein